jgi:hypothetical protein
LAEKEEELVKLQATIQEHREANPPSIITAEASSMIKTTLVSTPIDVSKNLLVNLKLILEALVPSYKGR